jgi:(E)-4-hydroxy-3-methylbut-2-enyl-diphosphate synthase
MEANGDNALKKRVKTRQIMVRNVPIGGGAPISLQSMTKTDTRNAAETIRQILELKAAGCDIVRVAIPDEAALTSFKRIRQEVDVPLVADIHFNASLAIKAIEAGADCIRINPGNIGGEAKVREVVSAAKDRNIPIRIGVNSGSVEKELMERFGGPTPEAMVESALRHVNILEKLGFYEMKISVKASSVIDTILAYRLLSSKVDYPLHLGVTEAGTSFRGAIKSALGIGILLSEGIGDTIRVSLTADPKEEVIAGNEILASLGLRERRGIELISCPTCGRLEIDLPSLVSRLEKRLAHINVPLKVSVLGCVVNGPGEAAEADIGIAGGKGVGIIIKGGKVVKKCSEAELEDELIKEIEEMVQKRTSHN